TRVVQLPPLLQQINCIARVKCLLKTHRCGPKASLGGLVLAPVAYSLHSGELLHRVAASFQGQVHLSFLLFLHRLAEEARTNAFENKSKIIKPEHTIAAAKVILKKSRG
uniref:Centromere protein W n=1 Tax=Gallus gallus TaxID=9031 RepID=A0A8V0XQ26_CHICK